MALARDVMTENPATVTQLSTVREAARLLHSLDVRHLPVVDEQGTLVGMLSDRDLRGLSIPLVRAEEYVADRQTALDATVATIMSSNVLSVELEDDVAEVIDLMLEHKVGAIPVVDGDGVLAGIVSYVDVLRTMVPS